MSNPRHLLVALTIVAVTLLAATSLAVACPFCTAVSLTFNEEIGTTDVVVFAKLIELPPQPKDASAFTASTAKAKFEITKVLKGKKAVEDTKVIEALYFGDNPVGTVFLIMGTEPPKISWATPIVVTDRGQKYISNSLELPKEGVERLIYFQDYLEDEEDMLARDTYDEFAKAPYAMIMQLKKHMHHDKLVGWIKDHKVHPSRRRLYLTMLGAYGDPNDAPMLATLIKSEERQDKAALDALVAAYLTLTGADGVKMVEDLFLKDHDAEYTDTYATIMALRFHGQEEKIIPRERLLEAMRTMLDRPQLADLVISDLARWEDWKAMNKLVELFKNDDEESNWVRVPVVNYLRACPLEKAKQALVECEKIDPDAVKRANSFFPFAGGAQPAPVAPDKTPLAADKTTKESKESEKDKDKKDPKSQAVGPKAPTTPTKPTSSKKSARPSKAVKTTGLRSDEDSPKVALLAPGAALSPAKVAAERNAAKGSVSKVFGTMAVSSVVMLLAFQGILRGGQKTA